MVCHVADLVGRQPGEHLMPGPALLRSVLQAKQDGGHLLVGGHPTCTTTDPRIDHGGQVTIKAKHPLSPGIDRLDEGCQVPVGLLHARQSLGKMGEHDLARDLAPVLPVLGIAGLLLGQQFGPASHVAPCPGVDLPVYGFMSNRWPQL